MEEEFVLKVRIKFEKLGLMQFVGHLDLMRAWQKIFRRSGIPIAYSEGFNPHQIFSIAAPLAVGTTSEGEYLDLKLKVDTYDLHELIERVNACCPVGLKITGAAEIVGKQTSAMAACKLADYRIDLSEQLYKELNLLNVFDSFYSQKSIIVKKKNKKGKINDLDIRPGIYSAILEDQSFFLTLATGSSLNIKPELFMQALFNYCDYRLETFTNNCYYSIHRFDIYMKDQPKQTLIEGLL